MRRKIKEKDIVQFFDLETEASKKRWEALMNLPIEERVRKRKAITNLFLDKKFRDSNSEGDTLLRVTANKNVADFKEGDYLILHQESSSDGFKCHIEKFEDDNSIILGVSVYDMHCDLDDYMDKPLILDKNFVDLRQPVFNKFIYSLPSDSNDFWNEMLLNKRQAPTFKGITKCRNKLKETINTLGLKLLPNQKRAILNSMAAKDYYLIQGPPGTGKSYILGIIMLEELFDLNHSVIVIGPNHKAINNAMENFLKLFPYGAERCVKIGQSYNAPTLIVRENGNEYEILNGNYLDVDVVNEYNRNGNYNLVGLTPHALYTSRARNLRCDTLIIDEAGQVTIPLALMGMIKAKKVIMAGDHKQLPPIIASDEVNPVLKKSVFQTLISDNNCTMLDISFRMCEQICNFVSEIFYDGELKAMKKGHGDKLICSNPLYSFDSPVIIHNVDDDGEQTSDKEVEFITSVIEKFISMGIAASDIGILSPFRAQAANVRQHIRKSTVIPKEVKKDIVADTIDKMQGQEKDVIIFSMVSGNPDYMVEMAEFLYNPNKLNVAFSRAKSKLIIVGNINRIKKLPIKGYPHLKKIFKSKYATIV